MNTLSSTADILVVDDNENNAKLLADMLVKAGFTVRATTSGALALRSIRRKLPDLIMLDIKMPQMDGYEVCEHLKADEKTREIPIIFLSVLEDTEDKVKGFQLGGVDYMTKPFYEVEVLARVHTHLALYQTRLDLERRTAELETANAALNGEIKEREKAEEKLRAYYTQLEDLVAERTADLRREIQQREQAEVELRQLNARLEWLARDTYHRVKNNLMVIEALLSMQAYEAQPPEVKVMLTTSRTRVHTMLLIHEKLHQSPDLTQVDFAAYLRDLATVLCHAYTTTPIPINLTVEAQNTFLSADTATSCGMIVNELVSNALKHAFKGRDRGCLTITLQPEDDHYVLTIHDDGIGMPEDWKEHTESLGMRIVTMTVDHLNGTLELDRSAGTKWIITFHEVVYHTLE